MHLNTKNTFWTHFPLLLRMTSGLWLLGLLGAFSYICNQIWHKQDHNMNHSIILLPTHHLHQVLQVSNIHSYGQLIPNTMVQSAEFHEQMYLAPILCGVACSRLRSSPSRFICRSGEKTPRSDCGETLKIKPVSVERGKNKREKSAAVGRTK